MPLFYQQNINDTTKLAIWQIAENESFFLTKVTLQRDITHPHKRLQHLAGRYLLRFLFPDFPNEEIEIASTRKPFLPDEQYHFSISHCGDFAAAIVSKHERVGVDIEIITEKVAKIAHKFLNEEERIIINSEMLNVKREIFNDITNSSSFSPSTSDVLPFTVLTLFWCAKETVYKWWGEGKVDFKEHIQLSNFLPETTTSFNAKFTKLAIPQQLVIHYKVFNNLCFTFTHNYFVSE